MKRLIITPPVLPPAALAELKDWLGITTAQDDAPLGGLLRAALELCEDFTGRTPLTATCEETLGIASGWQHLSVRPVQAIVLVEGIPTDGVRFTLASTAYELDLDADGGGAIRLLSPGAAGRIAVRFTAGIAADWAALPETLRHGMIRVAAHQHRTREGEGAGPLPPIVTALWRPWRRMRLA
ncbi:MAG: hypothetical protein JWQ16_1617 [Novosphingobium sp.]|nr:hypothetical protein [Novosphingobium sp.]